MRTAARRDDNHRAIAQALEAAGCSVCDLAAVGRGCPDLLVGFRGCNTLIEIKRPKAKGQREGKLTGPQGQFHAGWRGPLFVVKTVDEALAAIGARPWPEGDK